MCGNPAVAASNGIVASGPGNTGLPVLKLATEGKGASPKKPVGADAPDTETVENDLDKTADTAVLPELIPGGTNSEDTKVFERPHTEKKSCECTKTFAPYDD